MRSEKEMLELIVGEARADARIRAVCQNGSRTNPHARRDLFCDYDIVYIVRETRPFYTDPHWIDRFGERLYLQGPEAIDRRPRPVRGFRSQLWLADPVGRWESTGSACADGRGRRSLPGWPLHRPAG